MEAPEVQYVSDDNGMLRSVIIPIKLWKEIASELETMHLLKSDTMTKRILEARSRHEGISFEAAREKLGI